MGRSNLGGLSNEGEDLSRGQQLWIGLIVFQYSFLCVAYKSSFWGHIVYYSCALDRHTGNNSEKCLATPFLCQRKENLRACGWWTDFTNNTLSRFMRERALSLFLPVSYGEEHYSNYCILFSWTLLICN